MLLSAIIAAIGLWYYKTQFGVELSPDGVIYLNKNRPNPYSWRWLPCLLPNEAWEYVTGAAACISAAFLHLYLVQHGFTNLNALCAVAVFVTLPFFAHAACLPILTDMIGFAFMIAGLCYTGTAAFVLIAIGAMCNEKCSIFAATMTGNPYYLIPLVVLIPFAAFAPKSDLHFLKHPFKSAWESHKVRRNWLTAWGVMPLALLNIDFLFGLSILVAYLQLVRSTDYQRLVQWTLPIFFTHFPFEFNAVVAISHMLICSLPLRS